MLKTFYPIEDFGGYYLFTAGRSLHRVKERRFLLQGKGSGHLERFSS